MVDEWIPIPLVAENDIVPGSFNVVNRVLYVPLQQHGPHAHIGSGSVIAGVAVGNQCLVVGQYQVRFGRACSPVSSAFVPDIHVKQGTCDVSPAADPGLPRTCCVLALSPVRVSGICAAAAALAIVGVGRLLRACGTAGPVGLVAPGRVVPADAEEEMMAIRIRIVLGVVVGKSVGFRPSVFALIWPCAASEFGDTFVLIHVEDVVAVLWIFVSRFKNVPRISSRGCVRESGVVVDHIVECCPQRGSIRSIDRVVVAGRRGSRRSFRETGKRNAMATTNRMTRRTSSFVRINLDMIISPCSTLISPHYYIVTRLYYIR